MTDLWCIRIPGPDDITAQPSREQAETEAEVHNLSVCRYIASLKRPLDKNDVRTISLMAVVEPWPWSAEAHAANLLRNASPPTDVGPLPAIPGAQA